MTKEEMIKFAKGQYKIFPEDSEMGKYLRETMKMLQAESCEDAPDTNVGSKMQTEPCEDAVSRQAAKDKLKAICKKYCISYEDGERKPSTGGSAFALGHAFDDLPSVTPARKKGKWIRVGSGSLIDDFRCDCCNKQPPIKKVGYTWGWDFTRYCPNCGEPKEGEE